MSERIDKIYFVGIGGQRCGTTWLYRILSNIEKIAFPPIKELHFFDQKHLPGLCGHFYPNKINEIKAKYADIISELEGKTDEADLIYSDAFRIGCAPKLKRLSNLFSILTITNTKTYRNYMYGMAGGKNAFGEITPSYSMLDEKGFADICSVHRNIRFIFLLRDPLSRFWSSLKHQERITPDKKPIQNYASALEDPNYILRTDYKRTMECLKKTAGKDEILPLFFEEMVSEKTFPEIAQKLESALNIEGVAALSSQVGVKVNTTPDLEMPNHIAEAFLEKYSYVYEYIGSTCGYLPSKWEKSLYLK